MYQVQLADSQVLKTPFFHSKHCQSRYYVNISSISNNPKEVFKRWQKFFLIQNLVRPSDIITSHWSSLFLPFTDTSIQLFEIIYPEDQKEYFLFIC